VERKSQISRRTNETEVNLALNLDTAGDVEISTGIGFFDHMLLSVSKHALISLKIEARGDLFVDCHHTVEDTGIVFGAALNEALGGREGITRYGSAIIPMDEALVLCAIDLSGRAFLNFDVTFPTEKIGEMDTEMVEEFFRALAHGARMNLHFKLLSGKNSHHIAEGVFKSFARALRQAVDTDGRTSGVPSSKGVL
jgi:imidazoleglycerol-phosphate dehydratase